MKIVKENVRSYLLLVGMIAVSTFLYSTLPEKIATHFDITGQPDSYSSKSFGVSFIPAVYLFVIFVVGGLVKASPKAYMMKNSQKTLSDVLFATGLLLAGIHLGMLLSNRGSEYFQYAFNIGASAFLIFGGNIFGKLERNFFVGVRVPWTIASEANWRATHRFGGLLMVIFGVLLLVSTFFISRMYISVTAILVPCLLPIAYSYLYFLKNEK